MRDLTREEVERIRDYWSSDSVETLTALPGAMRKTPALILRLLSALDRVTKERDALRAEVDIPASYWSEYFEAGLIRSREQLTTDHDRTWWDWLQGVKARGWKDSPSKET